MLKDQITQRIAAKMDEDGLMETGVAGVRLFRATSPVPCAPAVYEPSLIAIVSGTKEAVLDGQRYIYDRSTYLCCPTSLPVTAGTPTASADKPLLGVYIALDQRVMTELTVEMDSVGAAMRPVDVGAYAQGIRLSPWDDAFTDALSRLLQLIDSEADAAVLGKARLRELYYAVLKGAVGGFARQAFSAGNAIARSIAHVSSNLDVQISIDDMAARAGMSRAVFHRKFKQQTTMSPIQFVKSMRLNNAAMNISAGMTVHEAAKDVGYTSASQFSREFRRMYGLAPREWGRAQNLAAQ